MPFQGQSEPSSAKSNTGGPNNVKAPISGSNGPKAKQERRKISQPTGKLTTNNVGIKETLNPTQRKKAGAAADVNSDLNDDFTYEQLEHVWKEYSLSIKRNKKDSFYSTLVKSKMTMSSDYQIQLDIINTVQAAELDKEKVELLGFLRKRLRNYTIGLKYKMIESGAAKVQILDSKGTFDKLAEENTSLNKFRKLFNLDIEF